MVHLLLGALMRSAVTDALALPAPSFWLRQLGQIEPRAPLSSDRDADVCIVGAGYTGLWTAYELCRAAPELEVVVVEAQYAGFGASGRNGGWIVGELAGPTRRWHERGGASGAAAMATAITNTVHEVGDVIARERIDCDYRHGGTLAVATSPPQLDRLRREPEEDASGADTEVLDAANLRARVNVPDALGGLFSPHCARVQPAKLVRALAEAAEREGATIYERTRVSAIAPGRVVTNGGTVRARTIVRATEGYTAEMSGKRRLLLPMNSSMIVTEPIDDAIWSEIGWDQAETLRDGAHRYIYAQRTADGRIAIGGRGVPYRFGSRTDREGPVPEATVRELRGRLVALFPQLQSVRVEAAWHGILGVARDWMPAVGIDRGRGLAWAGGYVGDGVAAANLAGRTLSDLILERDSELVRLPWVGPLARPWEPEPLRFAGVHAIYAMYRIADAQEARSGSPSRFAAVADWISGR
jgi:glycine/D-amino acid oxidase-like deaminating enzyme